MTHGCINDAVDANEEGDTLMKAANAANYRDITPIQYIVLLRKPLIQPGPNVPLLASGVLPTRGGRWVSVLV